jgi:hypothetical protein
LGAIGLILQAAYRLRRHFWLDWSLARWLGVLLFLAGLLALLRGRARPWYALLLAGLLLIYICLLIWAERQGYVRFRATENAGSQPEAVPLLPEELVPVRASGWFSVEGKRQYYVDLEADFETVYTREHIVLARVHPSRFLLLGTWPEQELGWWYLFVQPAAIRQVRWGLLYYGATPQRALQVVYALNEETQQSAFLASDGDAVLHRVWADLLLDAPAAARVGPQPSSH